MPKPIEACQRKPKMSETMAKIRAERLSNEEGKDITYYSCPICKKFHLTSTGVSKAKLAIKDLF